jgi:hypothetical protein
MLSVLRAAILSARKQWKIAAIVYFFQFCLALTLGLQVVGVLESSIGQSLQIKELLAHYDYTVMADFLKVHGASISPLIGELRWLLLIYLVFAVFIDAGLLVATSQTADQSTKPFWQGGANYFYPFLKIALLFYLLAAGWTTCVFLPIGLSLQAALNYFPNEKYTVFGLLFAIIIYLLGLSGLFLWSMSARMYKIKNDAPIRLSLKSGWQIFYKNKKQAFQLLALFFILQVALVFIYWQLDALCGMTSAVFVLCMALLQQVFSFCRVLLRQMFYTAYSGQLESYKN